MSLIRTLCSIGIILLILSGCNESDSSKPTNENNDKQETPQEESDSVSEQETSANQEEVKQEEKKEEKSLVQYAPKENIVKKFKGTGNEFATYSVETYPPQGDLYGVVEYSGTNMLKIFQVKPDSITLLHMEPGFDQEELPDLAKLIQKDQRKDEVMLSTPIEEGASFGRWTVKETEATVELPYKTLEDVIVVKNESNGSTTTYYWAKGLGIVKTEYSAETPDGLLFQVISELEEVKEK